MDNFEHFFDKLLLLYDSVIIEEAEHFNRRLVKILDLHFILLLILHLVHNKPLSEALEQAVLLSVAVFYLHVQSLCHSILVYHFNKAEQQCN